MNMCLTFRSTILCNSLNIWKVVSDNVWGASLIFMTHSKYQCLFWKEVCACVSFSIWKWVFMAVCCAENGKWKRGRKEGAWHPTADILEERRHYQTAFLGGMSTRLNGSINQTQSAVWYTFTHTPTLPPRTHTHNTRHNPTHSSQPTPFSTKY